MGVLDLLLPGDWGADNQDKTRRNFERLNDLFGLVSKNSDGFGFTVAGIGVRFGKTTLVFTAATTSAQRTVTHGLGRTPTAVLVGNWWVPGVATGFTPIRYDTLSATTFDCRGETGPGYAALTSSPTVGWAVVG